MTMAENELVNWKIMLRNSRRRKKKTKRKIETLKKS